MRVDVILQAEELNSKYGRISDEHAKEGWMGLYDAAASGCMHGVNCALGAGCQVAHQDAPARLFGC